MRIVRPLIFSSLAFATIVPSSLAATFEGKIQSRIQAKGRTIEVTSYFKDQHARADAYIEGTKWITMVFDTTTQNVITVDYVKHRTSKQSFEKMKATAGKKPTNKRGLLARTGKTGMVVGYPVEQYVHRHPDGSAGEWWLTPQLPVSPQLLNAMSELCTGQPVSPDLTGLVNLRTVRRAADGAILFTNEVIEISATVLPESLFSLPDQYSD